MHMNLDLIETKCGTNRENLVAAWKKVHPGIKCPKRNDPLLPSLSIPLLAELTNPKRSPEIVLGATELLRLQGEQPANDPVEIKAVEQKPKPKRNAENAVVQNLAVAYQTAIPAIPEPKFETSGWVKSKLQLVLNLNGYHWISILGAMSAVYGLVLYLDGIGGLVGALYCFALIEAIRAARNPQSDNEKGIAIAAVVGLEIFSGFIHFAWLNFKLWERSSKLPFRFSSIKLIRDSSGEITNRIVENATPGIIAIVLAVTISTLSIYAVLQQMNRTTDKSLAA